jgi:hypothetical protein
MSDAKLNLSKKKSLVRHLRENFEDSSFQTLKVRVIRIRNPQGANRCRLRGFNRLRILSPKNNAQSHFTQMGLLKSAQNSCIIFKGSYLSTYGTDYADFFFLSA